MSQEPILRKGAIAVAESDAITALRRFGLGARPGEAGRIASDPRGYVAAQLKEPRACRLESQQLQPSHQRFAEVRAAQETLRLARERAKGAPAQPDSRAQPKADAGADAMMTPSQRPADTAAEPLERPAQMRREAFLQEATARLERAVTTDHPFLERLVQFWSNHFCVSAQKVPVVALAGSYEREAIRPHVLGRFSDLLIAVEQHPAMLIYLDNQVSTGPNSRAGLNRGRGLNENLAREILELHTLGVNGGYTQDDVTNLARILTGWTIGQPNQDRVEVGKFVFAPNRHEPGRWSVLAQRYENEGQASGEKVLRDLAHHPATARHVMRKFACHFVSDAPPPALLERLERKFIETDGDLSAVASVLVASPAAWIERPKKVVPPYDLAVSIIRGLKLAPKPREVLGLARALGQPMWQPPSPKGFPDGDNDWLAPAALRERLRIAEKVALEIDAALDPRAAAEDLLGPSLSDATRQAVARAETREQGFELLIMSPEFQRR